MPTTITINLRVQGGKVADKTVYSQGSAKERKMELLDKIQKVKKARGKKYKVPHDDHSEDLGHDSWITRSGDTVIWISDQQFMLNVDYDFAPCDPDNGSPRNPFGWTGSQLAKSDGAGNWIVQGTDQGKGEQFFYKFTAMIDGAEALDPDGICDR